MTENLHRRAGRKTQSGHLNLGALLCVKTVKFAGQSEKKDETACASSQIRNSKDIVVMLEKKVQKQKALKGKLLFLYADFD